MKLLKILLIFAVIGTICYFILKLFVKTDHPDEISAPRNQFIERIAAETDALTKSPTNVFCKNKYRHIQYLITDYYNQNYLGTSENDNNHWKNNLSRDLYSAYSTKFVQQAIYVFSNSRWQIQEIEFIHSETIILQNSTYLEKGSYVHKELQNIQVILDKYYEISSFISECKNFSYSQYKISDKFPLNLNIEKIQKARNYLKNNLENIYVNNCARLHDNLNELPLILLSKHISYLHNKIKNWSGRYSEFHSQPEYVISIYTPLNNEIELLDSNIYAVSQSIFDRHYTDLKKELDQDNKKAYDYFNSHRMD